MQVVQQEASKGAAMTFGIRSGGRGFYPRRKVEAATFEIRPITRRQWQSKWPWWAKRVAGYRYFVNGVECDVEGKPL
jgi:hypothetical protein